MVKNGNEMGMNGSTLLPTFEMAMVESFKDESKPVKILTLFSVVVRMTPHGPADTRVIPGAAWLIM